MILAVLTVLPTLSQAATFRITAVVDADLATVHGTLEMSDCACTLVDPLAFLPVPADDPSRLRTFPNQVQTGRVTWTPVKGARASLEHPSIVQFEAHLPTRYGDVGRLPSRGLWADGGWYPLPVDASGAPVTARWTVDVALPPDVVGVLNGETGARHVEWSGFADRAALAVVAHGVTTEVQAGGGTLRFVESRDRRRLHDRVAALVAGDGWPLRSAPSLTLVEDLDLLHLATAAPGMVYLSARAFRVSPGLGPYFGPPVRRAMVEASVPRGVGWERSFVGDALTRDLPVPSLRKTLGVVAWNPVVNALLHDGTLPYYDSLFNEPFSSHPGLFDLVHPRFPAAAAARQVDDLGGHGTAVKLSRLLLEGLPLAVAARRLGIPAALVTGWLGPFPSGQDYAVRVLEGEVVVDRAAQVHAAAEVVTIAINNAPPTPWLMPAGPGRLVIRPTETVKKVIVDPTGHTQQADLVDARWPNKWESTFAVHLASVSPTQKVFELSGDVTLRRENDTRWLLLAGGSHDAQDLFSARVGLTRFLGPLLDRRRRPHQITSGLGVSLLDPGFGATTPGTLGVDAAVDYVWDSRIGDAPLRGHRYSVGVSGGIVPGYSIDWANIQVGAVQLVPIDARQVLAIRGSAGWAIGAFANRLLPLGGADAVRGAPLDAVLANERLVGNLEYRLAVLRNASIPLPLLWVTGLEIAPGIEAGVAWTGEELYSVMSGTLGVHTVTDAFGIRPVSAGVTAAVPVWTRGFQADSVQFYIDFSQSF